MARQTWDQTWMAVAETVGRRSICDRRKIGAVIVDATNRPVATGYNGPPAGFQIETDVDCTAFCPRAQRAAQPLVDSELRPLRNYEDCYTVHAEINALLFTDRREIVGGTLYVTSVPCWECGKIIANCGVARLVTKLDEAQDAHRDPHRTLQFLDDCGLEYSIWEEV